MISAVEAFVSKKLEAVAMGLVRDGSASQHTHRMFIDKTIITKWVNNSIVTKAEKAGVPITDYGKLTLSIDNAWKATYTKANILAAFKEAGKDAASVGYMKYDDQESNADRHVLFFYQGAYASTRKVKTGPKKGRPQSKINFAMGKLWKKNMEHIADSNTEVKAGGGPYHAVGSRNHGDPIGKTSDDQSTVAKLSVAENYDAEMADIERNLGLQYPENVQMVGQVMKHYHDAFERDYKIRDSQDTSAQNIDREIVIDITYGNAVENKDKKSMKSDVGGFRAFMDKEAGLIVESFQEHMKNNPKDILRLGGSPSFIEKAGSLTPAMMVQSLFKHATKPDMRFKVNKALLAKAKKASGKTSNSITKKRKGAKGKAALIAAKGGTRKKPKKSADQRAQGNTAQSPIALRNLLNELLPQMVASKMTAPALRFRTGRFANSARVENVNIGPRGGIGIDYTYQRDPYETFEPGNKQGSTQRDPRKIIGASIRELAMGIIGKQPTSIRRN